MSGDPSLSLRVHAEGDALVWEAVNEGSTNVRVWQQGNSWGWPMPRLHVGSHCLRPADRMWTRNFPSSVELQPGEVARWLLRGADFDPDSLSPVRERWREPLSVQAELRCEPSPEAAEHGVWCGTVLGAEQELPPPHEWLRP